MVALLYRPSESVEIFYHRNATIGLAALLATGCVAGPDYTEPAPPTVPAYVAGEAPETTASSVGPAGDAQYLLRGEDVPRGWWYWFGSEEMESLVERAFRGNPDIAAARARLRRSEALLRAQGGALLPQVDVTGSGSYSRGGTGAGAAGSAQGQPGGGQGQEQGQGAPGGGSDGFTVYTLGAAISYDLDLAGRNRRLVEAAEVERQGQEVQAAYLAMVGNIVSAALQSAALREQIAAREDLIESQEARIALVQVRVEEGATARAELVTQLADTAALRATIAPLRRRLAASDNRLAVLIGEPPATAGIPRLDLAELRLPETVPIALPSRLVRTRPDILAAEAVLERASAEIGVEAADLYPNVTLDAGFGLAGAQGGLGIGSPEGFLDLGAGLLGPLFDGGTRRAERDAAVASYEEALALYRAQVLRAFGEVADGIRALEYDAIALADRRVALEAAEESFELARFRQSEGAISVIDLLTVERQYQEARFAYIDAVATRFQDTAALFAALGPGPLAEEQLAAIAAADHLDATLAALERGEVPGEGL